jgi:16S rRNA (guanine1207-N2)-methyltransferase
MLHSLRPLQDAQAQLSAHPPTPVNDFPSARHAFTRSVFHYNAAMEPLSPLPARPQEQLLIEHLAECSVARVLTNTVGRGQFALATATAKRQSHVTCWTYDLFHYQQLTASCVAANVELLCAPDLPTREYDLVALALSMQGDGELARELLQQAFLALAPGGELWTTTDNAEDRWLGEQVGKLFDKVTCVRHALGTLYQATRQGPLKKQKNYDAEFAFRDGARLLKIKSRPGVFSHRHVDPGARALLGALDLQPGECVLDLGCGSGAVALAAAAREPTARVCAIDANMRAIQCVRWGAEQNGLTNLVAAVDCDGSTLTPKRFDLVLTNPPYFAQHRIAERFLEIAQQALRVEGRLVVVTKSPQWYAENLARLGFAHVEDVVVKNYVLVKGRCAR